jgi:hypothetical protein
MALQAPTPLSRSFRELPEEVRERAWPCLDVAAGAVLMASLTAAVIGALIFLARLALLLGLRAS